uniref:Uncharacterized protein n=1 Tax=Alexandrium monilatum TaxID=311494 RepID=A0A7S4QA38_9DINO
MAASQQSLLAAVRSCTAQLTSASTGRGGAGEIIKALDQLAAAPMTVAILKSTHAARVVNREAILCHEDASVRKRGSELVARWRQLVRTTVGARQPAAASAPAPATPPAAKRGAPAEADPPAKRRAGSRAESPASADKSGAVSTPPPRRSRGADAWVAESATKTRAAAAGAGVSSGGCATSAGQIASQSVLKVRGAQAFAQKTPCPPSVSPGAAPAANPTVSLAQALANAVPRPMDGRRSGGADGRRYFCFTNYKSGRCDRGTSCPYPHYSG